MERILTNLSFEQWVAHIFDHPVSEPAWHWRGDADYWQGSAVETVEFMTCAFENIGEIGRPFDDAQMNEAIYYVISEANEYMYAVLDESVDLPARVRCIRSFSRVFEQCFAPRCANVLCHLDERGANPLNTVCHIWWDVIPISGVPDEPKRAGIDTACLDVMQQTLQLESVACQESALHGLGHWAFEYPDRVGAIIDRYLKSRRGIRSELRDYARCARTGYIQ